MERERWSQEVGDCSEDLQVCGNVLHLKTNGWSPAADRKGTAGHSAVVETIQGPVGLEWSQFHMYVYLRMHA